MKSKNFVSLYWVSISFDISIANISWTVTQTSINHIIFWKSVMRTFRWIYANCFNRSEFLAEITTVLQNMHLFGQFKDHNSGRKHGNIQMTSFFASTFCTLTVFNGLFLFEDTRNSFPCRPPFGQFCSVKYLSFGQKLQFRQQPITIYRK